MCEQLSHVCSVVLETKSYICSRIINEFSSYTCYVYIHDSEISAIVFYLTLFCFNFEKNACIGPYRSICCCFHYQTWIVFLCPYGLTRRSFQMIRELIYQLNLYYMLCRSLHNEPYWYQSILYFMSLFSPYETYYTVLVSVYMVLLYLSVCINKSRTSTIFQEWVSILPKNWDRSLFIIWKPYIPSSSFYSNVVVHPLKRNIEQWIRIGRNYNKLFTQSFKWAKINIS